MPDLPRYTIGSQADVPDMLNAELTEQTASCTLPTGETITVSHRVPLYTLARELGKAERSLGHGVMLLAGAGGVTKLSR